MKYKTQHWYICKRCNHRFKAAPKSKCPECGFGTLHRSSIGGHINTCLYERNMRSSKKYHERMKVYAAAVNA